jgi:hypothetical protein
MKYDTKGKINKNHYKGYFLYCFHIDKTVQKDVKLYSNRFNVIHITLFAQVMGFLLVPHNGFQEQLRFDTEHHLL